MERVSRGERSAVGLGSRRWVAKGNFKGRTWGTGSAQRQFINRTTPYYDQRPSDHGEPFHRSFSSTMLAKNRGGRSGGSLRTVETIPAKVYDSSESHYSLGRYIPEKNPPCRPPEDDQRPGDDIDG